MRTTSNYFLTLVCVVSLFIGSASASACTGIRLSAADGTVIYARTMESALDFHSNIIMVPRGQQYVGMKQENTPGLRWTTKYAFTGPNVFGMPYIADGLNEKGLAVGHFVFADFAQYQTFEPGEAGRTIDSNEAGTFLLGLCATVPEAIEALRAIRVIAAGTTPQERAMMAYHYFVHDADGHCAVLEYTGGQLKVYDDALGVITNSPSFDWHLTNLRNYVHLDTEDAAPASLSSATLSAFGHGTGLLGLPGDFTPPSRFVRVVTFTQAAFPAATANECVEKAFHLLNQFDIPAGAVRAHENGKMIYEFTNWTTAADMQHLRYYFHTYKSRRIRMIDLHEVDLDCKSVKTISMQQEEAIEDVSKTAE